MWRKVTKSKESGYFDKVLAFTGDHIRYGNAMKEVVKMWPNTILNTFTNNSVNKRAFLGQCACSYKLDCPEYITRKAWKQLTEKQRIMADTVAQQTINEWVQNYKLELLNILRLGKKDVIKKGYQMKLQLN